MQAFNYEQSIWGKGTASLNPTDPTAFRLRCSLNWLRDLPAGSKILEIGTGAGQFIRAFKKNNPAWECFGTDISKNALNQAGNYQDGVDYKLMLEDKLPYDSDTFSAVLIFDVLEHVNFPEHLIKEIYRVLRKGGYFYCFIPCEGDKLSAWYWLRDSLKWSKLTEKYAGHINRWSRRTWLNIFQKNGFNIEKINYSEHFLGQLLGLTAFYLMDRGNKNGEQINNEKFFSELSQRNNWFRYLKKLVNILVYWESVLGRKIPSPNIHILLKK